MASEDFFQAHPVFTHKEYARSRGGVSPRTVDSLLRHHVQRGRLVHHRDKLGEVPRLELANTDGVFRLSDHL